MVSLFSLDPDSHTSFTHHFTPHAMPQAPVTSLWMPWRFHYALFRLISLIFLEDSFSNFNIQTSTWASLKRQSGLFVCFLIVSVPCEKQMCTDAFPQKHFTMFIIVNYYSSLKKSLKVCLCFVFLMCLYET